MAIIKRDRSIIPACDVQLDEYEHIVSETSDIEQIGAYKVGFQLGLLYGLPKVVEVTRKYSDKPIIYDHQKSGSDIPSTGKNFARTLKKAGVNVVIHFSHSGPDTQKSWIESSKEEGLEVIIGGLMTHSRFLVSEGGWIADEAIREMYSQAAQLGVTDFVVPGNKPAFIEKIRNWILDAGIEPTFYAPGFVAQGGLISDSGTAAGDKWHAIVGRGIYQTGDIRTAALAYSKQL